MPTYEYECAACGHKFEEFQSMSAKPIRKCPSCKQNKVRRLISGGAGFIFKGTGFYITDYRSDSYKADAKNDTAAVVTKPETSATKSESANDGKSAAPAAVAAGTTNSGATTASKSKRNNSGGKTGAA